MKRIELINIVSLLLLLVIMSTFSCKKDVINKDGLFVYAPAGKITYDTWKDTYLVTRNGVQSQSSAGFPVLLTRPFSNDVQVIARIDTSLIASYDSINKTVSPRFNTDIFGFAGTGTVTIKAGKTVSADSITIRITDNSKVDFDKSYIIPVVLSSPGNEVPVSNNRQTMFVNISFTKINTSLSGFTGGNNIPVIINRTPDGDAVSPDIAAFQATINTVFPDNLDVNIVQDNTLIEGYNAANGTACIPFPANAYTILQQKVSIPANALASKDSFKIQVSKPQAFEPGKTYLLPFQIKDEGPVAPSEKNKVMYITLTVKSQIIDPANGTVTVTTINRAGWKGTANSTDNNYSNGVPADVFDNNYATGWQSALFPNQPPDFVIDMGNVHTIKGFSFTPLYWSFFGSAYISDATSIALYSSTDGVNWFAQGDYNGTALTGTADKPDTRFIKCYQPIKARYFKFTVLKYSNYAAGFGELNAFE